MILPCSYGKFFMLHSDGYILDIIEHLVDLEIDAVNSQLFCMDIEEIGRRFKGKITFWGEISRQHVLCNPDIEITRQAVRKVKSHLFDERGGVIAQCSYEGKGIPDSIMTVYEEWAK
jgi:uroporphyrinogen decarboxylase